MAQEMKERRASRRYALSVPVEVRTPEATAFNQFQRIIAVHGGQTVGVGERPITYEAVVA